MSTQARASRFLVLFLLAAALSGCGRTSALVHRHRKASRLLGTDRRFALRARREGARRAFAHYLAHDAVFFPEGAAPLTGRRAILAALPGRRGPRLDWTPEKAWVNRRGTVGTTEGVFVVGRRGRTATTVRYGDYLALWVRRAGHWRVRDIMQNLRPPL
jgi:hypothetical protein